jgi:hypothetical protein
LNWRHFDNWIRTVGIRTSGFELAAFGLLDSNWRHFDNWIRTGDIVLLDSDYWIRTGDISTTGFELES